jgi:hypothetical protein
MGQPDDSFWGASSRPTFSGTTRDSDLDSNGRSRNQVIGANLKYGIYTNFTLGVEYDYFDTEYKEASNRDAHLLWFSGILDF